MIGCRLLPMLALSAALAAVAFAVPSSISAPPGIGEQAAQPDAQAPAGAAAATEIVELLAHRRSGVVSALLSNGLRIHHRLMAQTPGQVEIMVCFAGGELLESQDTRGLTLLAASYFDQPAAETLAGPELPRRLVGRDVRIEGGLMSDSFLVRISGAAADVSVGLEVAAAVLRGPVVTVELLDAARAAACSNVERTQADTRWAVTEPLLELVTPINECRNKLACTKRMSGYTPEQLEGWITRHASTAPCEVAIVGDIELSAALDMAVKVMGTFPARTPAAPGALAEHRCVAQQRGPFAKDVGCKGNANVEEAHVLAGFLSPDPSQILEVRRLRAGARVLSERLENRLRELKLGGDPHVSWTYMPSPFAGRSVTVVSARVAPGDAEPVKRVMQASMCELIDHGLPADELARSTDMLARVAAAYERDPRYWASILSRSGIGGIDPDLIADSAEVYRSMKPDEVLAAMRRACTVENRLDLVVRPAP